MLPLRSRSLAQLETLYLAGCRLRQFANKLDISGVFVRRQPRFHKFLKLITKHIAGFETFLQDDESLGLHQPIFVGRGNHRRLQDRLMGH